MSRSPDEPSDSAERMLHDVEQKQQRKMKARKSRPTVWFGLGLMGMIGWSVALPLVLGALLGHYLDRSLAQEQISWTLLGVLLGAVAGCWHAWYWIERNREKEDHQDEHRENS